MKIERLGEEFPKMPDEMRTMVEQQVAAALSAEGKSKPRRFSKKKVVILTLAATMALGATVFAGTRLYQMYTEKQGNYGLATGFKTENVGSSSAGTVPNQIPVVDIVNNYIPEGMITGDTSSDKLFYEETPYQGGISMVVIAMDDETTAEQLKQVDTDVKVSEELEIAGHDAVYLEKQTDDSVGTGFDKKFYIAYPEVWHVLEVFVGEDTTKEEALKVLENTELKETGETESLANAYTWSDFVKSEIPEDETSSSGMSALEKNMNNVHQIGDTFQLQRATISPDGDLQFKEDLTARVSNVQIADDLELLGDSEYVEESWKAALGADGKLLPNEKQYLKSGDGIHTLDETVKTETVAQKLVYWTVDYTNTGDEVLEDVLFFGTLVGIQAKDGEYTMLEYAPEAEETDKTWDTVVSTGVGGFGEMGFYDLHEGEQNNNHILNMAPGETVTVNMARIVNEDELMYLYLYLDLSTGSMYEEAADEAPVSGYVDFTGIRAD